MEAKLLAKIVLRLLAVYLIARGLMFLPEFFTVPFNSASGQYISGFDPHLLLIMTLAAPIIAGIILWIIASLIANWMVGTGGTKLSSAFSRELQAIAISTAGLIIAIFSIPNIVGWFLRFFENSYYNGIHRIYDPATSAYFIAAILQFLLGLFLILGVRFWVRLLRSARECGLQPDLSE